MLFRSTWPLGLVGVTPALGYANLPSGKYVVSVDVDAAAGGGTIQIVYGLQANANIANPNPDRLDLVPAVSLNGDVVWVCGRRAAPGNLDPAAPAAAADGTTILDKYLPANCRA